MSSASSNSLNDLNLFTGYTSSEEKQIQKLSSFESMLLKTIQEDDLELVTKKMKIEYSLNMKASQLLDTVSSYFKILLNEFPTIIFYFELDGW